MCCFFGLQPAPRVRSSLSIRRLPSAVVSAVEQRAGDSEDDHGGHEQEHPDADHTPDALLTTDSVGEPRFAARQLAAFRSL